MNTSRFSSSMLIGIYSPCEQCGKSTLTDMIEARLAARGIKTNRDSFSVPIKAMVEGLLRSTGMDEERVQRHVRGDLKEAPIPELGGVTSRHIQATLGTPWARRMIHPDFWVFPVEARLARTASHHADRENPEIATASLFEDLRFPNEHDMLHGRNAILIQIFRTEAIERADYLRKHGSPEEIDRLTYSEGLLEEHEFDATICNDGTLADLEVAADRVVSLALERWRIPDTSIECRTIPGGAAAAAVSDEAPFP